MSSSKIKGVNPPLTTPFNKREEVDEAALRGLLDFQLEHGIHGLFLCGTYGSGPLMSRNQRTKVVEIAIDQVKSRIPIMVHVGTPSTEESIFLSKHAEDVGADLVAAVPPYYHRHNEKTIMEHYKALVEAVNIPVYIYNNPKTSGFTLTPDFLVKLADNGVQGIKDSCFSFVQFSHFRLALQDRKDFVFVIGTEALLLPSMLIGAQACISGLANAFPEIVVKLYNSIVDEKYSEAAKLQLTVNKARQTLHIAPSTNAACYAMLKARGLDVGQPKRPILPITESNNQFMIKGFKTLGLL